MFDLELLIDNILHRLRKQTGKACFPLTNKLGRHWQVIIGLVTSVNLKISWKEPPVFVKALSLLVRNCQLLFSENNISQVRSP